MLTLNFKDFVWNYVSVFWAITNWKELQIWFNEWEKDKRKQREMIKSFRQFIDK